MKSDFTACRYCVAPKRHPGCHDHCEEYKQEKAQHEEIKAELAKQKAVQVRLDDHIAKTVHRITKKRRTERIW